ncbi:hypothetical protein [Aestuariirhabdus sp. LZHN29]|uniref:hypothetical protein n=1 Tax=Aestuariirhabdus sp. LZHN29 TaxID=3417462 RepID=UPI003CF87021
MASSLKVIHIVGAGRSGSTVFDTVLGNADDIESVGELCNAPQALLSTQEYCACGSLAHCCEFWCEVMAVWKELTEGADLGDLIKLQRSFIGKWQIPRLIFSRLFKTNSFIRYQAMESALYNAIARVSGHSVIVDSSKNPMRAYALSNVQGIDTLFIHLVRDGRGIAWSLKKAFEKKPEDGVQSYIASKPIWRTSLFWVAMNLLTELLLSGAKRAGKLIRVRYEDFTAQPSHSLSCIQEFAAIRLDAVISILEQGEEMAVGHTVAGNRARMAGALKLRPDHGWKQALCAKDLRVFWWIAGPMAKRYGYQRRVDL